MDTYVSKFLKARSTDSTDANFPSKAPTLTQPSGDGVLAQPIVGQDAPALAQIVPVGVGADNSTFDLRVIGWRPSTNGLWVPIVLVQAACTLSAVVGVAASDILNTSRFADTITLTLNNSNIDAVALSRANDTVATFVVDTKGCPVIEVTFDLGTATAANALVAWV